MVNNICKIVCIIQNRIRFLLISKLLATKFYKHQTSIFFFNMGFLQHLTLIKRLNMKIYHADISCAEFIIYATNNSEQFLNHIRIGTIKELLIPIFTLQSLTMKSLLTYMILDYSLLNVIICYKTDFTITDSLTFQNSNCPSGFADLCSYYIWRQRQER